MHFLGFLSLFELLRVKADDWYTQDPRTKNRFWQMREKHAVTFKAGRFLAAQCQVDPDKESYGMDEVPLIQETLDREYPGRYSIMVRQASKHKIVFHGSPRNPRRIEILWVDIGEKHDFFGLKQKRAKESVFHSSCTNHGWRNGSSSNILKITKSISKNVVKEQGLFKGLSRLNEQSVIEYLQNEVESNSTIPIGEANVQTPQAEQPGPSNSIRVHTIHCKKPNPMGEANIQSPQAEQPGPSNSIRVHTSQCTTTKPLLFTKPNILQKKSTRKEVTPSVEQRHQIILLSDLNSNNVSNVQASPASTLSSPRYNLFRTVVQSLAYKTKTIIDRNRKKKVLLQPTVFENYFIPFWNSQYLPQHTNEKRDILRKVKRTLEMMEANHQVDICNKNFDDEIEKAKKYYAGRGRKFLG